MFYRIQTCFCLMFITYVYLGFDVVSLVSLISPLQLPQVRFDKAVMGCGTSRNVVAPQSITIEDKPRKDFVNEETPVCTEKNVETISPPSPTPSQRSTSSRVSIRSKSDRPGSRGGKSSLRKRFEKMKQEVDLMGEGGGEVGVSGQDKVVSTREPSAVSKVSGNTTDSGYADENPCMITEDSTPHEQEVAKGGRPTTPDLSVSGKGLMSRRICSATTRHLQELKVSLKPLQVTERSTSSPSITSHKQSLSETPPTKSVSFAEDHELSPQIIQRPASRGGMAFDIQFTPETGNTKHTPSKLARLERKTKSAEALRQDLEERMRAAEERRKVGMHVCSIQVQSDLFTTLLY